MTLTSFLDPVLGPVMTISNPWNILLLSFVLTLVMTLLYKFLTNQKLMKQLKEEMKLHQKEIKELKNMPEKMMETQKVMMDKQIKYFLQSLKPTIVSFIPVILIFTWMRNYYLGLGNPAVLFGLGWIWAYILSSIIFSIGLRKLLKVH